MPDTASSQPQDNAIDNAGKFPFPRTKKLNLVLAFETFDEVKYGGIFELNGPKRDHTRKAVAGSFVGRTRYRHHDMIGTLDIDVMSVVLKQCTEAVTVARAANTCKFVHHVVTCDPSVQEPFHMLIASLKMTRDEMACAFDQLVKGCRFTYDYNKGCVHASSFDAPLMLPALQKRKLQTEMRQRQAAAWLAKVQQNKPALNDELIMLS